MRRNYVEITVTDVPKETVSALLCVINGKEIWIPKSQIDDAESDVRREGDSGTLVISEWIAMQKGLI